MKTVLFIALCFLLSIPAAQAQEYFDMGTTSALVSQNKKNYSDHQKARDNQLLSQATVSSWKSTKASCKKIMDSLNARLTQAYIVYADLVTVADVATAMADITGLQAESLGLAAKYPYALQLFVSGELKIVDDAVSLYKLVALIVISYGDINKLSVASRKMVFMQVSEQLRYLRARCKTLNGQLKSIELGDLYRNTKTWNYIDMDKTKMNDILKGWKN